MTHSLNPLTSVHFSHRSTVCKSSNREYVDSVCAVHYPRCRAKVGEKTTKAPPHLRIKTDLE